MTSRALVVSAAGPQRAIRAGGDYARNSDPRGMAVPKISAPTVRQHREIVKTKLVDAAERLLRESGPDALSAAAVAAEVGIARNSIYRYVDSVDDLRLLTLARYIPRWREAIFSQIDAEAPPVVRLRQFAVASLRQSNESSHGWLMSLMHARGRSGRSGGASGERAAVAEDVADIHAMADDFLREQWEELGVENPRMWTGFTRMLLLEAFAQVEAGEDLTDVAGALGESVAALGRAAEK